MAHGNEIEPERLYAFGDSVELDGRGSWMPPEAHGRQPMHCYVMVEGQHALIVDPGPAIISKAVVAGVHAVVPAGAKPPVFLTRYQLDGIGNLAAIAAKIPLGTIYSGGVSNPFDSFDQVTSADGAEEAMILNVARIPAGGSVLIGAGRELRIVTPMLRILTTFWAFDDGTGTLFTSDSFTHVLTTAADERPVLDDGAADATTVREVRAHLLAAFDWLRHADVAPIVENVCAAFDKYEVVRIAPARGCVIEGRDLVERHRDLLIDVLNEIEEKRP